MLFHAWPGETEGTLDFWFRSATHRFASLGSLTLSLRLTKLHHVVVLSKIATWRPSGVYELRVLRCGPGVLGRCCGLLGLRFHAEMDRLSIPKSLLARSLQPGIVQPSELGPADCRECRFATLGSARDLRRARYARRARSVGEWT